MGFHIDTGPVESLATYSNVDWVVEIEGADPKQVE